MTPELSAAIKASCRRKSREDSSKDRVKHMLILAERVERSVLAGRSSARVRMSPTVERLRRM